MKIDFALRQAQCDTCGESTINFACQSEFVEDRQFKFMKDYFVYILRCSDGSYYTGVTSNLEKRLNEHNLGFIKGYTSERLPVDLVYSNRFGDVNDAIRTEKQIKGWSRQKKRL